MRIASTLSLIISLSFVPAAADVARVAGDHIQPGYARLAAATTTLAQTAQADCHPDAVVPAYHAAYDAWIWISHIQFGPVEDQGLALAMSFWPDPKNRVGTALRRLTQAQDPIVDDPQTFDHVSVAAQGFTALERLLFIPQDDAEYACRLTSAIALGLADKSADIALAWPEFALLMTQADSQHTDRFQSKAEVQRAMFTALSTGLEFLHDQRLGRPLGTFDRPRPRRAEARRSGRTLRHIQLSLAALENLAELMTDAPMPKTRAAFAQARARAEQLDDPALAGVADPATRFRIEVLQQAVAKIQDAVRQEIGQPLGITAGFNALDGD